MNKIEEKALKIFECRKEKIKKLEDIQKEKTWEEKVEEYIKKILDIFEASNLEENATIVVWQVYLYLNGKRLECKICFDEEENNDSIFYHEDMLGTLSSFTDLKSLEKTREAMCALNSLNVSIKMMGDIITYISKNLNKYFTADFKPAGIVVKMKRETDCENIELEK